MKNLIYSLLLLIISLNACGNEAKDEAEVTLHKESKNEASIIDTSTSTSTLSNSAKIEIVSTLKHSTSAFTQGLIYHNGFLYESTGLYGSSSLRKLDPKTGAVLKEKSIANNYFGEGITIYKDKIYMLTWQNQVCLVFDINTFEQLDEISYMGEGWGLLHDGEKFIMSDGTNNLRFFDNKFKQIGAVSVSEKGIPINMLNELELINGEIWANAWQHDYIYRIDKNTGEVKAKLDFKFLWDKLKDKQDADVLNGIAYDKSSDTYYITGKNWESIFVCKIK